MQLNKVSFDQEVLFELEIIDSPETFALRCQAVKAGNESSSAWLFSILLTSSQRDMEHDREQHT